jgi:hypothetical protein
MPGRTTGSLRTLLATACLAGLAISTPARAEKKPPVEGDLFKQHRYEALVGFGGAHAYESDVFNLSPDNGSHPDGFLDFRLRQLVTDTWALGFHVFGTSERTADYLLFPPAAPAGVTASFDLTLAHVGLDARYRFLSGPVQPYVEIGASYVAGAADNKTYGHLNLVGFSIGPGAGVTFPVGPHFLLGTEVQYAYGRAKWNENPSLNSSGRDYDPSLLAFAGTLGWRWGH